MEVHHRQQPSHAKEPILHCDECTLKCVKFFDLKNHKIIYHKTQPSLAKNTSCPCNMCDFVANTVNILTKHKEQMHSYYCGLVLNCNKCDFLGNTETQLKDHTELLHTCVHKMCLEWDVCKAKTEEMPETIKHTESIQRQQSKNKYDPIIIDITHHEYNVENMLKLIIKNQTNQQLSK